MYRINQTNVVSKTVVFQSVILILGLLILVSPNLFSQEPGFKFSRNYSYKEYDHQPQNWGVAQAPNGLIYFANHGGILEYDGVSWRLVTRPLDRKVRSLAIDETGTVYVGGYNDIGYLTPDAGGGLKHVSLLEHLKKEEREFGYVWRTFAVPEGVYFASSRFLFRWNPTTKQMKVWPPGNGLLLSFTVNGRFFIHQKGTGLMQMVNDSLEPLPGKEFFTDPEERVFMMAPYGAGGDDSKLLIGTRKTGFYLYDGWTVTPLPTDTADYLRDNRAGHGIRLVDGDYALATSRGGLVIMDPFGRRKKTFIMDSGLQSQNVAYVFEDNQGNLWLCLGDGVSKIEYSSRFYFHDDRSGLTGLTLSMMRHHGDLYAGTTQGLNVMRGGSGSFQPVGGVSSACWSLLSDENSVLAATDRGVLRVNTSTGANRMIIADPSYALYRSRRHPHRTWCGTLHGVVTLSRENGRLGEEHRFKNMNLQAHSLVEDADGDMWVGSVKGTVLRIPSFSGGEAPAVTGYGAPHGLPGGEVYVTAAAGRVLFATLKGIYRFDEKSAAFIPDPLVGEAFAGGEHAKPVFRIVEDNNKNIWFHSEGRNYMAVPGADGKYTLHSRPFRRLPVMQVNAICPDGENIWFAGLDGLFRYDTTAKKDDLYDIPTLFRNVTVNGENMFSGYGNIRSDAPAGSPPAFKYDNRNFHFEYAAPFFEAEPETRYRSFLEGYDDQWSEWKKEPKRDYTNLDAGRYTFRIQGKNVYGKTGGEGILQFEILLPWYKTWWAWLLYVLFVLMLTYLIFKWRRSIRLEQEKKRLEQDKIRLEQTVDERTRALKRKSEALTQKTEELQEMNKVKSRFFANISHEFRTPLTLLMGPLEKMLADGGDEKQETTLHMMLRNSRRVLNLINQLLDLSRFDGGKMKLSASLQNIVPFLKGAQASFETLARDKKLNLTFHSQAEDISLYFDAQKMEDVLSNLLLNAVKFTPAGGDITVSVSHDPGQDSAKISVRDTGIGIPMKQFTHIFDRFYQAGGPGKAGGTGIGLSLVQEIVQLHRGKIDVHSQEGKGTEFVILLPMGRDHLKPDEIVSPGASPFTHKRVEEIESLLMKGDGDADLETVPEPDGEAPEKNVILVVDDNADVRKYIREPLEAEYTVVEARDGKEGIEKAREIIPDLIVSDIMMPEIDGNELCRKLKTDVETSHIPIILLTAKAADENIIEGLETGADDYITKPFNTTMMMVRIKNLIELRGQLQSKFQRRLMLLPDEILVSTTDEKFLKEFRGIINKHFADSEFNIDILSKKLYMGRSTVFRKIHALTGKTPNQLIMSFRLERAAQLLTQGFGNVTETALEVGFSSAAYFTKCFKEKYGRLPSVFQASESPAEDPAPAS